MSKRINRGLFSGDALPDEVLKKINELIAELEDMDDRYGGDEDWQSTADIVDSLRLASEDGDPDGVRDALEKVFARGGTGYDQTFADQVKDLLDEMDDNAARDQADRESGADFGDDKSMRLSVKMTPDEFIDECTKGGPGLDGYAYNADVYCISCGEKICEEIADTVAPTLTGTDDPGFSDSETCPQPIFFGESDVAEHCAECGKYLYGGDGEEEERSMRKSDRNLTDTELAAKALREGRVSIDSSEITEGISVRDSEVSLAKKYCDYGYGCTPAYPSASRDLDSAECEEKAVLVASICERIELLRDGLLTAAASALQSGEDYDETIEMLNVLTGLISQLSYTQSDLERYASGEIKGMNGEEIKYYGWPNSLTSITSQIERVIGSLTGVEEYEATAKGLVAVRDLIKAEGDVDYSDDDTFNDESSSGMTASGRRLQHKAIDNDTADADESEYLDRASNLADDLDGLAEARREGGEEGPNEDTIYEANQLKDFADSLRECESINDLTELMQSPQASNVEMMIAYDTSGAKISGWAELFALGRGKSFNSLETKQTLDTVGENVDAAIEALTQIKGTAWSQELDDALGLIVQAREAEGTFDDAEVVSEVMDGLQKANEILNQLISDGFDMTDLDEAKETQEAVYAAIGSVHDALAALQAESGVYDERTVEVETKSAESDFWDTVKELVEYLESDGINGLHDGQDISEEDFNALEEAYRNSDVQAAYEAAGAISQNYNDASIPSGMASMVMDAYDNLRMESQEDDDPMGEASADLDLKEAARELANS